jgi:hypothetical protein
VRARERCSRLKTALRALLRMRCCADCVLATGLSKTRRERPGE